MQINYPADGVPAPRKCAANPPTWHVAALSPSTSVSRLLGAFGRRWVGPVAIALVLFEGIVRMLIYSPRPQIYDRLLGQIPAPGSTWVFGQEGFGHIHWNRQGIRGRDLPVGTAARTHRLVVMGNSFCVAEQVNDDQTYCARLEGELSRRLHQDVWVGNCGRRGLSAADFLCYLPAFEKRFHPELIVITYGPDDFRVRNHRMVGDRAQFDPAAAWGEGLLAQPLTESHEDLLLQQHLPDPVARLGRSLIDHSGLALYGAARLHTVHWQLRLTDGITQLDQIATVGEMERYFAFMIAHSKTPIACAYIAPYNPVWGESDQWAVITEQRLARATARLTVPFIDSSTAFRRYVARTGQPANGAANTILGPGIGHLNPDGHRIMAETMAPTLARILSKRSSAHRLRAAQLRAAAGCEELARLPRAERAARQGPRRSLAGPFVIPRCGGRRIALPLTYRWLMADTCTGLRLTFA
jgi:hypothetical protein